MSRRLVLGVIVALALVGPAQAGGSVNMAQVWRLARHQAAREEIAVDASGHKVFCTQTGRLTALCRFRMLNATDSDGNNYDCSMWVKYRLRADGYIHSNLASSGCTR